MSATMKLEVAIQADPAGCLIVPEGSRITGLLNLAGRKDIKSLPEGLRATNSVNLSGSAISELPRGMKVAGWLDMRLAAIGPLSHIHADP